MSKTETHRLICSDYLPLRDYCMGHAFCGSRRRRGELGSNNIPYESLHGRSETIFLGVLRDRIFDFVTIPRGLSAQRPRFFEPRPGVGTPYSISHKYFKEKTS